MHVIFKIGALIVINVRTFLGIFELFFINGINACNFENWCVNEKFEKNRTKNAYIDARYNSYTCLVTRGGDQTKANN